jgi:hypothetical protein
MKRNFLAILVSAATITGAIKSNAQSTLLYYWNFNTWTPLYTSATPGVIVYASIPADYAAPFLTTSNAKWVDRTVPGTSSSYATYCDNSAVGDTLNARMGDLPGAGFKARNPNDSIEILIYAPTTHYANLRIKYACQLSSYTSGDSINVFSYSVDSGSTFISSGSGLSKWIDSGSVNYRLVNVQVNDPMAFNNAKFVFRINMAGRASGASGNNRFDNVTFEGDTLNPTLGIIKAEINTPRYTVFPNPVNDIINVTANMDGDKSVLITNVMGQTVVAEAHQSKHFALPALGLSNGLYYITIRENESGIVTTIKIVKQ